MNLSRNSSALPVVASSRGQTDDSLSRLFLLLVGPLTVAVALYGPGYVREFEQRRNHLHGTKAGNPDGRWYEFVHTEGEDPLCDGVIDRNNGS